MGDAFDNEKDRGKTFDRAMAGFLQGVGTGFSLHGHEVSREVGRIYHLAQRCVIFREDKVEIGTGGDAYTQVARTYDLACEQMKENDVTPDAPVFLLCVMGDYSSSLFVPILMSDPRAYSHHRGRVQGWQRYSRGTTLFYALYAKGYG